MPDRKPFASIDEFRAAAKDAPDKPLADACVRASFDTEIVKGDGESRTRTFIISTPTVDRMGDTIKVEGWKLDNFRKNPVVLWAHDAQSLPLAKADKVWIEGGKLMAAAAFTPPGVRFNDTVLDMIDGGFLSATSVGFAPLKYAFTDDPQRRFGIDFLEQELLEFSIVPVPANAEALVQARSAGIDIAPVRDWIERVLRRDGQAVIPVERLDKIERAAKNARLAAKRNRELDLIRLR